MARIGIGACLAALALPLLAGCGGGGTHVVQPAERHLAYLAGDDPEHATVWLANVDGSHARRLGQGSAAALSPDGRTIAVQRPGGIYLLSADGPQVRRLTSRSHLHPQAWSPDGKTLIVTRSAPLSVLELDAVDKATGKVRLIASGSMYGFGFSPDGSKLVYSRAPVATGQGLCGDQFDLYVTKVSGGKTTRLTHDGLSAFPVWGRSGIAYARFPEETGLENCSAPGIWTVNDDGTNQTAVIARAPGELSQDGLYGLQPVAWLDDTHILAGVRTNAGMLGAIVDTQKKRLRQLTDFVDAASTDGRYVVGSGGDEDNVHLAIVRIKDGRRIFRRISACCPSWNR